MFRFANDATYRLSEVTSEMLPNLAKYIKSLMSAHTSHYTISLTQINQLEPKVPSLAYARISIEAMLRPYGWKVTKSTSEKLIFIKAG